MDCRIKPGNDKIGVGCTLACIANGT